VRCPILNSKKLCLISHHVATAEIGRLQLWGYNNDNKLGNTRSTDGYPVLLVNVTSPSGSQVLFGDAALADRHSLLCSSSGVVYGSGYGVGGLLFTGDDTSSSSFIPWAYSSFYRCLRVFNTRNNSFVLTTDAILLGVGDQSFGQLGFVIPGNSPSPYQILSPNRVLDFAVGQSGDSVYAIASTYDPASQQSNLYCWGSAQAGVMSGFSGMVPPSPSECIYLKSDLDGRSPLLLSAGESHTAITLSTGYLTWSVDSTGTGASVLLSDPLLYNPRVPSDRRNRITGSDDFVLIKTAPIPDSPSYGVLRFTTTQEIYRWGRGYADPTQLTFGGQFPVVNLAVGRDHALFVDCTLFLTTHLPLMLLILLFSQLSGQYLPTVPTPGDKSATRCILSRHLCSS
jgi:hypothetical protein